MNEITFVTAWVNDGFSIEYPIKLYNGIKRNCQTPFKFVIICDQDKVELITKCKDMKAEYHVVGPQFPRWWSKIKFFDANFKDAWFFDLDVIICDNISDINIRVASTKGLSILFNFLQPPVRNPLILDPCEYNSSIMYKGPSSLYTVIYDTYVSNPMYYQHKFETGGDQKFIEYVLNKYDIGCTLLQYGQHQFGLEYFRSIKYPELLYDVPTDCKIVCYHGKPRPHKDTGNLIVRNHWI